MAKVSLRTVAFLFAAATLSTCSEDCEETAAVQLGKTARSNQIETAEGEGTEVVELEEAEETDDDFQIGYWAWAWSNYLYGPENQTFGICFGGYTTAAENLAYCLEQDQVDKICSGSTTTCTKWLAVGGGYVYMNESVLSGTVSEASAILAAGFGGVIFDAEKMVQTSDLVAAFSSTTAQLKAAGLLVGVTTSHSAPLECDGCIAANLVIGWCGDENIDVLSPQLYSDGSTLELEPTSACQSDDPACTWSLWENCKAPILPSIPYASDYDAAQAYFNTYNITFGGYIQWLQSYNGVTTYWCGTDWNDAATGCHKMCQSGQNTDCDSGQYCYQPITTCSTDPDPNDGTTTITPKRPGHRRHQRRGRWRYSR